MRALVDLINHVGRDPWICVPHMLDDAGIRAMAAYCRDNIDPGLTIRIEYSNEIWNFAFEQAHWCGEQGQLRGYHNDLFYAAVLFGSARTKEIWDIWMEEFAGQESRLMGIKALRLTNDTFERESGFLFQSLHQHPIRKRAAVNTYFGHQAGEPAMIPIVRNWTQQQLHDWCRDTALPDTFTGLESIASWLQANAPDYEKLDAYEGGQHLAQVGPPSSEDPLVTALFTGLNRSQLMADLYTTLIDGWRSRAQQFNLGVFVHFSWLDEFSFFGSWGASETIEEVLPKHQVLLNEQGAPLAGLRSQV